MQIRRFIFSTIAVAALGASIGTAFAGPDFSDISGSYRLALSSLEDLDAAQQAAVDKSLDVIDTDDGRALSKSLKKIAGAVGKTDKAFEGDGDYETAIDSYMIILSIVHIQDTNAALAATIDDVQRNPLGPATRFIRVMAKKSSKLADFLVTDKPRKKKIKKIGAVQKLAEKGIRRFEQQAVGVTGSRARTPSADSLLAHRVGVGLIGAQYVGRVVDDLGMAEKTFRPWAIDQIWLLPPSVRDFVPEGHVAHVVRDVVRNELDLSAIFARYTVLRGHPPYHPTMMVSLLLYAMCRGVYSSRRIEIACKERMDFMAVTAMAKPDHSTICKFRNEHREALAELFVQVLSLCRDAGIAKLGHVSLDGTKVAANASKHAAMSYGRMKDAEPELAALVEAWLETSQSTDEREDDEHGEDRRGDELPPHIKSKISKLAKVRAAKAALEAEAQAKAERLAAERAAKEAERGKPLTGPKPKALDGVPEQKAQRNFTDPESRIMKTGDGYVQAYNAHAAVDAESQVIVACELTNRQNDHDELTVLVDQIECHLGERPTEVSADANYCSEENLAALIERGVRGYIATGRQKHGTKSPTSGDTKGNGALTRQMRTRLRRGGYRSRYRLRKHTVEPVFGQIKECRGLRRFLHRGLEKVTAEWRMLCTAHNLLKLAAARA